MPDGEFAWSWSNLSASSIKGLPPAYRAGCFERYRRITGANRAGVIPIGNALESRGVLDAPLPSPAFEYADLVGVDGIDIPARSWVWEQWVPRGHVTVLSGAGGTGKSLLAQTIAPHVVCGDTLFGGVTTRGTVLGLMCEDDNVELQRRQRRILAAMGRASASCEGLHLEGRAGKPNLLVSFGPDRSMQVTALLVDLEAEIDRLRPILVILDNIAQLYSGIENDRYQVTAFCNELTRLAGRYECAVLLLGHVAKADGSEFSGSTAWDAAVRSRLWLERRPDGLLELHRKKANYAGLGSVLLEYRDGALVEVESAKSSGSSVLAQATVLGALDTLTKREIATSHSPNARTNLVRIAEREDLLGTVTKAQAASALRRLLDSGRIVPNATLPWKDSSRHAATGLALAEQEQPK